MMLKRLGTLAVFLALVAAACGGREADAPAPTPPATTTSTMVTTTTRATTPRSSSVPATGPADEHQARVWRVDPVTLERIAGPTTFPGVGELGAAVGVPGGHLVFLYWPDGVFHSNPSLAVMDPDLGLISHHPAPAPYLSIISPGFSPVLNRVLVQGADDDETALYAFDPDAGVSERILTLDSWFDAGELLADGAMLATYQVRHGTDESPWVATFDLTAGAQLGAIELDGVTHGSVEIDPVWASDPDFPFASVEPGLAWDRERSLLFIVDEYEQRVTRVDLLSGEVDSSALGPEPSLWASAFSWLISAAEAKGYDNEAFREAWLSDDGSRLYSVGQTQSYFRDPDSKTITITTGALDVLVIDTETLEVLPAPDVLVTRGILGGNTLALSGEIGQIELCDEVCNPARRTEPDIRFSTESYPGLILADAETGEVRVTLREGANFYPVGVYGQQLVAESFGSESDGAFFDSVNLATGELTGRVPFGDSYFVVTDVGVFEVLVEFPEP